MSILNLLDKKWVGKFLQNRFTNYFPEAEKLIGFEIKIIRVFLNYQRLVARYNLILSSRNENFKKSVMVKAEKKTGFLGKTSGTKIDYLTNLFLREQKLDNLVVKPLEYYRPLQAFFYEPIEGLCLKQLSIDCRGQEFINFIPLVAESAKKIHCLKNNKIIVKDRSWENKQYKHYLFLAKKYYPFGFKRFENLIQTCRDFRAKNKNDFSSQNYCLTHGDLHSGNIFIADQKIKLLDFSDAGISDPFNDLGCFFINTELMFEYDFHQNFKEMTNKVKSLFCQNYFNRDLTDSEKKRIYYYGLNNLYRIISYVALSESQYKKPAGFNDLLEKLIKIGEEKLKNI